MKYAGIIKNDVAAAPGVCLSFFVQGCPLKCNGCHNPEAQDFNSGKEFTQETMDEIIRGLTANNLHRTFCIMGGEPLCQENTFLTYMVIKTVREHYPDIKIYLWTGYVYEELEEKNHSPHLKDILENIDVLIDGPYIEELRDITLPMRGSSNQRIIDLNKKI